MDPDACLNRAFAAVKDNQFSEALFALGDYWQWRLKQGFEPPRGDMRAMGVLYAVAYKLEGRNL